MTITPPDIQEKIREVTAPGQFFEIEKIQVAGQTMAAFKNAPATLIDVFQGARQHGDADFIVYEGERYSFNRFFDHVDGLAAVLQKQHGIAKRDRVALAMRNSPEFAIAFTAVTLVGGIVVPINSWGKTDELHFAIADCGAKFLICDYARFKLLERVLDELNVGVLVTAADDAFRPAGRVERFETALTRGSGLSHEVAQVSREDHCVILYTSGSTASPKGALHRHLAMTQALMNMMYLGFVLMHLEGPRQMRGGAEREAALLTMPLFHATGLVGSLILPAQVGHKVVMMYKWDRDKALQLIQDEKVTSLSTAPAILLDLLVHPEFDRYDTSSLIRVAAAGAATPAGLPELIGAKLGKPSRSAGYGMTETMAIASTMSGAIFDLKPQSAGVLSPIIQMRFADSEGRILSAGEQGEIQMKGVTCMETYWNKPEANRQVFTEDGWLRSGDVGVLDSDGFLHITGRTKEIVIRGSENIFPGDIESVAYRHGAIQEVVVFGVADPRMGEELAMVCYLRPGGSLSAAELRAFLSDKLAGYKVPKYIAFSAKPLPRNASEKLHKLNAKAAYLAGEYGIAG